MIYQARELAAMPREQLWALPEGKLKVQMDDGVISSNNRETIFSVYHWVLYTLYPKTPALMRHHLNGRPFTGKSMQSLLNEVLWDCYDAYDGAVSIEELKRVVGQSSNEIYNDMTYRLESYGQSMSALDLVDIVEHPEIKKINEEIRPNLHSIENAHRRISKILNDPKQTPDSIIAVGCRSGIYKIGQVLQCVSARGALTDIDNNIFRKPIIRGYIHGLRSIHDLMVDSRSASKSLSYTEKPLQESQYFNRRLQLITDTVSDVFPTDCNSNEFLHWHVLPEHLEVLDGKYYNHEGRLYRFNARTADGEGLIGKTLNFRSVLYCKAGAGKGFCETCFGEMRHAIVPATNPGHVACTKLGERVSQIILSNKHHDKNTASGGLHVTEKNQTYIRYSEEHNSVFMSERIEGKEVWMVVDAVQAGRLPDVMFVEDVNLLQISLISSITKAQFVVKTKRGEDTSEVPVSTSQAPSAMSKELLLYVKNHGWELTPNGNYMINLTHWNIDQPLFTLPMKNANMLDYMKTIEAFLSGAKTTKSSEAAQRLKNGKTITHCVSPDEALREFYDIVSTQLKINIAFLEVMILSYMIRSANNHDYRLPLPGNTPIFGKFSTIMAGRSMSVVMAYERQKDIFNAPQTYLIKYRPDHPLDPILEVK